MRGNINADPTIPSDSDIINLIYPVGSIYMSVNNVNPGAIFGGTWVAWGSGRVPVGVDTGDGNFNSAEKTGGSNSESYTPAGTNSKGAVTDHTYTPAGTVSKPTFAGTKATLSHTGGAVSNTTLTVDQIPGHTHPENIVYGTGPTNSFNRGLGTSHSGTDSGSNKILKFSGSDQPYSTSNGKATTDSTGGGKAHGHGFTQPTAHTYTPEGAVSQPTFSGTKATLGHSVTQPTFSGTAATISHLQPYITCYMWKRTK